MRPLRRVFLMLGLLVAGLTGCGPVLSGPGVQPVNKVEQGVVIGVRGMAAKSPVMALIGSGRGSGAEQVAVDATVFEYIVRKANDDLVSVTQVDQTPLALGQKVRVVGGNRARVTPDHGASAELNRVKPVSLEAAPADMVSVLAPWP